MLETKLYGTPLASTLQIQNQRDISKNIFFCVSQKQKSWIKVLNGMSANNLQNVNNGGTFTIFQELDLTFFVIY